jgi:hypothetical protein
MRDLLVQFQAAMCVCVRDLNKQCYNAKRYERPVGVISGCDVGDFIYQPSVRPCGLTFYCVYVSLRTIKIIISEGACVVLPPF